MIAHFMEEAALVDRVIVLDEGKVARVGTPQEVLVDVDALSALNLGVQYCSRTFPGRCVRQKCRDQPL